MSRQQAGGWRSGASLIVPYFALRSMPRPGALQALPHALTAKFDNALFHAANPTGGGVRFPEGLHDPGSQPRIIADDF